MSSTAVQPATQQTGYVDRSQVAVVIPTYCAAGHWKGLTAALAQQGIPNEQVLIVDSGSTDGTGALAEKAGFRLIRIPHSEFNHGGTRQFAVRQVPWAKIVLYLTQDALPRPGAFDALLCAFDNPSLGGAYGRQLPRPGAGPIEAHARRFNYPARSRVHTYEGRHEFGIKTVFFSNSFAAYRVAALEQVGGFPSDGIVAEDAVVAARMLIQGWKTAYVAEAEIYHSHAHTIAQEFRRYFDNGVHHVQEGWLREHFGNPHGEGRRFVLSELRSLLPRHFYLVPNALLRTGVKYLGYQLGRNEAKLSNALCRRLSGHTSYWNTPRKGA
jgi:rhamnosyltransferase